MLPRNASDGRPAHRTLHVATAQVCTRVGDVPGALEGILRQIRCASCAGADVVLFASGLIHTTNPTSDAVQRSEPMDGPSCCTISQWAREYRIAVLAGFLERDGDVAHISHLIAKPDGTMDIQRKCVTGDTQQEVGIMPGSRQRTIFAINGIKAAISICSEACVLDADEIRSRGVEHVFSPCSACGSLADMMHENELSSPEGAVKYETNRTRVFIASARIAKPRWHCGWTTSNTVGFDGLRYGQGHCIIVDNLHYVRAQIPGTNVLEHQQDRMTHAEILVP